MGGGGGYFRRGIIRFFLRPSRKLDDASRRRSAPGRRRPASRALLALDVSVIDKNFAKARLPSRQSADSSPTGSDVRQFVLDDFIVLSSRSRDNRVCPTSKF